MSAQRVERIGVIADTYGFFDPSLSEHFAEAMAILHVNGKANTRVISLVGSAMPEMKETAHKLFD